MLPSPRGNGVFTRLLNSGAFSNTSVLGRTTFPLSLGDAAADKQVRALCDRTQAGPLPPDHADSTGASYFS